MGKRNVAPVPQEYLELLGEFRRNERKRPKVAPTRAIVPKPEPDVVDQRLETPPPSENTANSWHNDTSDEDDEWENVDIEEPNDFNDFNDLDEADEPGDVVISFTKPEKAKIKALIPRKTRIDIHYICLASLFIHTRIRNKWTLLKPVQKRFKGFLPIVTMQELHPPGHLTSYLKTKKLLDGLRHACQFWRKKFSITKPGLYAVAWEEMDDKERRIEGPLSRDAYIAQLDKLEGSTDLFCQGFCAVLRASGLECRLVCSLQPPDFTSPGKQSQRKNKKRDDKDVSSHPIYWTEVWDPNGDAWISVDPMLDYVEPIRRRSGLEPPKNDNRNILRYCIAWSQQGTARDVTRRYANQFNSRTRKKRLPFAGAQYEQLYERLLAVVSPQKFLERDIKELKYLKMREFSEGFPTRIQDFKNHPLYVLEEQLKKTEFLDPKEPIGRVAVKDGVTMVYSRDSVQVTHSGQSWYRRGRVLKQGQQPKLHREAKNRSSGEVETVGLYALAQTEPYVPPAIGPDNVVPKSEFKTIDIFMPSMIPRGGAHIRGKFAQRAAKAIGVDYANAVVSVEFSGRGPTSKYDGIVVAKVYEEAVKAVMDAHVEYQREATNLEEEFRLYNLWRKFIVAAQIRARIDAMNPSYDDVEPEVQKVESVPANHNSASEDITSNDSHNASGSGGFIPEAGGFLPEASGGFLPESGGFMPEASGGFIPESGGFIPEPVEGSMPESGGFMPEPDSTVSTDANEGGFLPDTAEPQEKPILEQSQAQPTAESTTKPSVSISISDALGYQAPFERSINPNKPAVDHSQAQEQHAINDLPDILPVPPVQPVPQPTAEEEAFIMEDEDGDSDDFPDCLLDELSESELQN